MRRWEEGVWVWGAAGRPEEAVPVAWGVTRGDHWGVGTRGGGGRERTRDA